MKMALPTNSMRFISGDVLGMSRLSARPERNAPMIGSSPASWARKAPRKTIASTKMYCETLSLHSLKNQWAMIGKSTTMMRMQTSTEMPSLHQNVSSMLPVAIPTITVSSSRASVSVMTVPPTAIVTALSRAMPSLFTIG